MNSATSGGRGDDREWLVPYDPALGRPVIVTPARDDPEKLRAEIARLRKYLHAIEDAETLELAHSEAGAALYL